jgi:UDP-N-acetylmuramate-alanine ligase
MVAVLRAADRTSVAEAAKAHEVSEATVYAWRKHFGAMDAVDVKRLRAQGIHIMIGHAREHLGDAAVVVYSSAVKADNPELAAARARHTPTVKRAEMLAELMRLKSAVAIAGTHGKTTTTTMVAALLEAGGFDPTVINGGIINAYGTNARLGQGEWMVVEADESDGTIVKLPATIAIVTNIDPEHLDHYKGFNGLKQAFDTFVDAMVERGLLTRQDIIEADKPKPGPTTGVEIIEHPWNSPMGRAIREMDARQRRANQRHATPD